MVVGCWLAPTRPIFQYGKVWGSYSLERVKGLGRNEKLFDAEGGKGLNYGRFSLGRYRRVTGGLQL